MQTITTMPTTCESCEKLIPADSTTEPVQYTGHDLCWDCYNETLIGMHAMRSAGVI